MVLKHTQYIDYNNTIVIITTIHNIYIYITYNALFMACALWAAKEAYKDCLTLLRSMLVKLSHNVKSSRRRKHQRLT